MRIPLVFIGDSNSAQEFFGLSAFSSSDYCLYTVAPVNALQNTDYLEQLHLYPNFIIGPGTAGYSLAHLEAQLVIKNHWNRSLSGSLIKG